jgi:Sulfotransferase domain
LTRLGDDMRKQSLRLYLRGIRDALLLKGAAGRSVTVFPDDTYLVSYPRSGNTWTRFLIANLLSAEGAVDFESIERAIPEIKLMPDRVLRRLPRPRILKSHEFLDPRYPKIIYIVRDPRAVAVSKFHWNINWKLVPEDCPLSEYLDRFLQGEFGSWPHHVIGWLATLGGTDRLLLLRYEDIFLEPAKELARVATFLGIAANPLKLAQAVERSTAERMRSLEGKQSFRWMKFTRRTTPFVRKAKTDSWKSALSQSEIGRIEAAWWPLMKALGYEPISAFPNGLPRPAVSERTCEILSAILPTAVRQLV